MNDKNIKRTYWYAVHATNAILAVENIDSVAFPDGIDRTHFSTLAALITYRNFKHPRNRKFAFYTQCTLLGIVLAEMT